MYREEPLVIHCHLATPVVMSLEIGLPLDGILNHAMGERIVRRKAREGFAVKAEDRLPLRVTGGKHRPFYAASWATFPQGFTQDRGFWAKRFDFGPELLEHLQWAGKINVKTGRYKAYKMPLSLVVAPELCFYALGDGEKIAGLLGEISHVGKKSSQGWGEVVRWKVEPCPIDLSVKDEQGRPMRAIPDVAARKAALDPAFAAEETRRVMEVAYRPPYHQRKREWCLVPDVPG